MTTLSTWANRLELINLPPGEGQVDLEIESLNLMPARYYISLWIMAVGNVRYDILDHCVALDVETSDVYDTGRGLDPRYGVVFVPAQWSYDGFASKEPR